MLRHALRFASTSQRRICAPSSVGRFFSSYPPHEVVGLPALSPTMEQGNLAKWRLKEGGRITAGDIICEIETDKAVVDFEAQDDMFLAKILVPEGTEGIAIGQPIMVTCDEEEHLDGLKDFKLEEESNAAPEPAPRAPEATPPKKEEVPVDPSTGSPVVPNDFLVTAQTTQKPEAAPAVPQSAPQAPPQAPPKPAASQQTQNIPHSVSSLPKWGQGIARSPISHSLAAKQQTYIDLYGITGTVPVSTKSD